MENLNFNVLKRMINENPEKFLKRDISGKGYICELCGSGSGKHGTGITTKKMSNGRLVLKCWKCGESGDVIHWLELTKSLSYDEVLEYGAKELSINIQSNLSKNFEKMSGCSLLNTSILRDDDSLVDYTDFYDEAMENLLQTDYWKKRGLSEEICRKFSLGYVENWKHPKAPEYVSSTPRLIVPISQYGYLARDVREVVSDVELEYIKSKVGKMSPFNLQALSNEVVYIVEGEIDTISMYEVGATAVGLGSLAYKRMLIEELKKLLVKPKVMIIALDNDEAGRNASESFQNALQELGILSLVENPYGEKKDANEALMADIEGLKKSVKEITSKALKLVENQSESEEKNIVVETETRQMYLTSKKFKSDVALFNKYAEYKTGYSNLDSHGSLYPGLYVLGAVPSLGKTTFMNQMSYQMTESGRNVLFVSYEQSQFELVTKGLSRLTYDTKNKLTAMEIRRGADVKEAIEKYSSHGDKEVIYEAEFDDTVDDICGEVEKLMKQGINPIVIVDYLQVIAPSTKNKGRQLGTKDNIDNTVKKLKSLQRENNLVVFLISSLNRQNYLTQIDFESFKESGGIEYTADVVWGMQFACMQEPIFEKSAHLNEKRERVREAKSETPRKVELICLKNRYGRSGYRCLFNYYPAYDYFEPCTQDEIKSRFRQTKFDEDLIV